MKHPQTVSQNSIRNKFIMRIHGRVRRGSLCDSLNLRNRELGTGTNAPRVHVTCVVRGVFSESVVAYLGAS